MKNGERDNVIDYQVENGFRNDRSFEQIFRNDLCANKKIEHHALVGRREKEMELSTPKSLSFFF